MITQVYKGKGKGNTKQGPKHLSYLHGDSGNNKQKIQYNAIREETSLEGIHIGGMENKICFYADDVLITL